MSKYAVITTNGNKVINIVEWDGSEEWGPGKGYTTVELSSKQWCDIDSVYDKDKNKFTFPDGYERPAS